MCNWAFWASLENSVRYISKKGLKLQFKLYICGLVKFLSVAQTEIW